MSCRLYSGVSQLVVFLALAVRPGFGDEPPTLVKIRLKGGRSIVGELIEQSRERLKLRDLKSGKEATYPHDELLKVERDTADSQAIAAAGMPVFVAWKLSHEQVSSSAGKIAEVKPTAIYVTIGTNAGVEKGQKLTVYRDEGEVKDPDTGEVLERQRAKIAEIEVTETREKFSKAKLLGDLEVQLRVGDEVESDQGGTAIAVLPPVDEDGNRTTGGEKLAEELTTALVTHGIKVVERTLLDKAFTELELQQEGAFDEASARMVGKQLGARAIMTGQLVQVGRLIEMHVRLIKVDTGEILLAASQKKTGDVGDIVDDAGGARSRAADRRAGNAFNFDGNNRILTKLDSFVPATLEAWVKPEQPRIVSTSHNSGGKRYIIGSDVPYKGGIGIRVWYDKIGNQNGFEAQKCPLDGADFLQTRRTLSLDKLVARCVRIWLAADKALR